jgi:hypothetical protein
MTAAKLRYRPALDTHKPEMLVRDAAGAVKKVAVQRPGAQLRSALTQGDDLRVATARDFSHGIRQKNSVETARFGARTRQYARSESIRAKHMNVQELSRKWPQPRREAGNHQSYSVERSLLTTAAPSPVACGSI